MKESEVDLAAAGLSAYQDGDFEAAIKYFGELTRRDNELWDARFYLGMAYFKTDRLGQAVQEFRDIAQWCPDETLKAKALVALRAMNAHSHDKLNALKHKAQ